MNNECGSVVLKPTSRLRTFEESCGDFSVLSLPGLIQPDRLFLLHFNVLSSDKIF